MSQYVLIIGTVPLEELTLDSLDGTRRTFAISTSHNPPVGLQLVQSYCPIPLYLIHSICAQNRAELLRQTLEIKFRKDNLHSFWYSLTASQIQFLTSLNEANFQQMIGFIHRQERKPDLSTDEALALINDSLTRAANALQ